MIIPFFIPHAGCPHQCVFCNQKSITGENTPPDISLLPEKISAYLRTNNKQGSVQLAFYGGSFTALPLETQLTYLTAVQPFIRSGTIQGIRISTRPDNINEELLPILKTHHVQCIELGVQSMNDTVLFLSGRGHTAADTVRASQQLKKYDFITGLQLMPGLPGDSSEYFMNTVDAVIDMKPDFVRIYPALVIKGTPLQALLEQGLYTPLSLKVAVAVCGHALQRFEKAGISVIRIGLQSTRELEKQGTILAGPYHPAFRQLVESSLLLDKMRLALKNRDSNTTSAVFQVNPKDLSAALGQRRSNMAILKSEFGLQDIRVLAGHQLLRRGEISPLSFS